ncbi:MAG: nucleotidyltransferase domain-containing protein [Candidatus Methanospirareceae archaeon]
MGEAASITQDFAVLADDDAVLALLLFGSGARAGADLRSDRDICIVAPELREPRTRLVLLRAIFNRLDLSGKRYDLWFFEELPLCMKIEVIEHHAVICCRDLPALYEYFYFYRRLWGDQKHHQDLEKQELLELLDTV